MSVRIEHGGADLPAVTIDDYNAELRDHEGFIGDRASNRAFRSLLDDVRERLAAHGADPLGDKPTADYSKSELDRILKDGAPDVAGVVHTAIEDFAQEFAAVLRRFMRLPAWQGTERVVVGGGLRDSRVGELAIGRAGVILKGEGIDTELTPIRNDPDEAGLIGGAHLAPAWMFQGHDSILSIDIGGTNARAGLVLLNRKRAPDLARASVVDLVHWRHADDRPTRDQAVERIVDMLQGLIKRAAKEGHALAPFVAVGCPGLIAPDGHIDRGGQNLPGNWEAKHFNLPQEIVRAIPRIAGHDTTVVLHNDAVVQGLSEVPFMQDVTRWGVMTIGTGLGNARFTNKPAPPDRPAKASA